MSNRIYFASYGAAFAPFGSQNYTTIHGLQSLGMNTRFNLEPIFEVGQLNLYQNYEELPDIEVTAEKCLDGNPLLYHWGTYGAPSADLAGRSNQRCMMAVSYFPDTQQFASGTPLTEVECSGLYVQSVGYNFQVQGPSSEQVTFVGNNKTWKTSAFTYSGSLMGTDVPAAAEGVDHRQDFDLVNSRFPTELPGISSSGTNDTTGGFDNCKVQSARTSVNLGRTPLLELGHKTPYFRYAEFPAEVRTEFEVLLLQGDLQGATEGGILGGTGINLANQHIFLQTKEGTKIELGTQNKLTGVNVTGGNAQQRGGNVTATFQYQGWNIFTVTHPKDPTVALQQ